MMARGFELPPLSKRLVGFCVMRRPDCGVEEVLARMREQSGEIARMHQLYIDTVESERKSIVDANELRLGRAEFLPAAVVWAREKYRRTFRKYHELRHSMAAEKHEDVAELLAFLNRAIELRFPMAVDMDAFRAHVSLVEDPELVRYERRITALVGYIRRGIDRAKSERITSQRLVETLKETVKEVDTVIDFVPMNVFDEMFMEFAIQSKLVWKFEQLIAAMPSIEQTTKQANKTQTKANLDVAPAAPTPSPVATQFSFIDDDILVTDLEEPSLEIVASEDPFKRIENVVDFSDFDMFAQFFFLSLGGGPTNDPREFTVMRCAAIRALFDFYYIKHETILSGPPCPAEFVRRCRDILSLTPRDLEISQLVVGEPVSTMPMEQIVLGNPHLTKCLRHLAMVPMFVNPMDMAYCVLLGMQQVEHAARVFAIAQVGEEVNSVSFELGCDNLFSLFMPVFALGPIPDPLSLRRFLELFKNLTLPQALDYALVSARAAIDHINERP